MDGFRGGTSGLSIGHVSPEASEQGLIALIENDDLIQIDIPKRKIHLAVNSKDLELRKQKMLSKGEEAWNPIKRKRRVSSALQLYASVASSADKGAVRDLSLLKRKH